jgi:hypothetical protein
MKNQPKIFEILPLTLPLSPLGEREGVRGELIKFFEINVSV